MNRIIALLLIITVLLFGCINITSCSNNDRYGEYNDEVRYGLTDVSSLFNREKDNLEDTVSYIFTDPGNFKQTNADKAEYLTLYASADDEALRRNIYEAGFTNDNVIDLFVYMLYDSQIAKIVWNSDDSVDFYLNDGYSVLTNAEVQPEKTGLLAQATVYELDRNWFFYESYDKLIDITE